MRYEPPTPQTVTLVEHQGCLEAIAPGEAPGRGVRTAWESLVVKGGATSLRGLPLLRALGGARRVVDATAGLGMDAWTMALAGAEVTMWERSPVLAALLRDGIRRMRAHARAEWREAGSRMSLVESDARTLPAATAPPALPPEVVYVDPMFPPKRRSSALASREVRFIGAMVGEDPDAAELLAAARRVATSRVVVKRPHHAPPLGPGASHSLESTLLRFDVYPCGGAAK